MAIRKRSLSKGGLYKRMDSIIGRLISECSRYKNAALIGRQPLSEVGRLPLSEAVLYHTAGRSLSTAVSIREQSLSEGGLFQSCFYLKVVSIKGRTLSEGRIYQRAESIRGWTLSDGGLYQRADSIREQTLLDRCLYQRADSIKKWTLSDAILHQKSY